MGGREEHKKLIESRNPAALFANEGKKSPFLLDYQVT